MATVVSGDNIETKLLGISGVFFARAVRSEDGALEAVRVLASDCRTESQIARDVVTTAKTCGEDISLSHVRVSRVAVDDWHSVVRTRPRLESVLYDSRHTEAECTVSLVYKGRTAAGRAGGSASGAGILKTVARATLRAINKFVQNDCVTITFESAGLVSLGGIKVAVVLVSVFDRADAIEYLTGSCPIGSDVQRAIAKATLDALNRRFEIFLQSKRIDRF